MKPLFDNFEVDCVCPDCDNYQEQSIRIGKKLAKAINEALEF